MKMKRKPAPWASPFQMTRMQKKPKKAEEIIEGTICGIFVREIIKSTISTRAKNEQAMASK
jgi:hypothetical protein